MVKISVLVPQDAVRKAIVHLVVGKPLEVG